MILCAALCAVAAAGDRDPLPARWIERPLVLPRGWARAEASLALHPEGGSAPLQALEARRDVLTLTLGLGILPRIEGFLVLPCVRAVAEPGAMDAPGADEPSPEATAPGLAGDPGQAVVEPGLVGSPRWGAGDPTIGAWLALLRAEPPSRSLALQLAATTPHGALGGALPLDVGLSALHAALWGRLQLGGIGLEGQLGGTAWLPGPVGWLDAQGQGAVRVDPGDGGVLSGAASLQAGPLVPRIGAELGARGADRVGAQQRVATLASTHAALAADVRLQLSRGAWASVGGRWPLHEPSPLPGRPRGRATRLAVGAAL